MEPLSFTIDCRELVSRAAAHDCFARVFSLPAGYGRNLDALYDVLTSLPPCRITLAGTSCLYPLLGAYAEKLLAVFRDAARDNEKYPVPRRIRNFLSISHCLSILQESGQFSLWKSSIYKVRHCRIKYAI